jgi:hypothetical protein
MFDLDEVEHFVLIACPNPPEAAVKAGKALKVTSNIFNSESLIKQLPAGYHPEVVQVTARHLQFRPSNLSRFGCPTVLKLGDTGHWGNGSLSGMVDYARALSCDFHWTYQYPQHLHFFAEAGLRNVFWVPGSIGTPSPGSKASRKKSLDVVFRGSLNSVHIHRKLLIDYLRSNNVPINAGQASYRQSFEDYSNAIISFNCSGNGDLNRRVFEVLLAGGFLLTDRLSKSTGLTRLFKEGRHFECYGSKEELLEKCRYYLAHPEKAAEIARNGHHELMTKWSPDVAKQILHDAIFGIPIDPMFWLGQDGRSTLPKQHYSEVARRIKIYEFVQELHAINSNVTMLCVGLKNDRILDDLADLPRIDLNPPNRTHYDLIYSEDSALYLRLIKKLNPGGLFVVESGAKLQHHGALQRIHLVDSVTRLPLAKDVLDVYQAFGGPGIFTTTRRPLDILRTTIKSLRR